MPSAPKEDQVCVAVVPAGSVPFDTAACVDKALRLTAQAAAQGARLELFPEPFTVGCPKRLDYGLVVGARDPAGREQFRLRARQIGTHPCPARSQQQFAETGGESLHFNSAWVSVRGLPLSTTRVVTRRTGLSPTLTN